MHKHTLQVCMHTQTHIAGVCAMRAGVYDLMGLGIDINKAVLHNIPEELRRPPQHHAKNLGGCPC